MPLRFSDIVIVCAVVLANGLVMFWTGPENIKSMVNEHGVLENLQAVLLALSSLIFLAGFLRGHGPLRPISGALAALCLVMLFREIDWRLLEAPLWLQWSDYAPQRDILFIGLVLLILAYVFSQRRWQSDWLGLFGEPAAWPAYVALALILVGFVVDIGFVADAPGRKIEELIELDAYAFLLVFAWRHARLANRRGVVKASR